MKTAACLSTHKLFVACCTFLVGAAATTLWFYFYRSDWCSVEEDCIVEAVYRYQIENSEGHKPSSLFFLAREEGHNPPNEVVQRLKDASYRVKVASNSVNQHTVIRDKETGEPGVALTVGKIRWVDKTTVEVDVSAYSGWGDVKAYVYHLVRGNNGWVVKERVFAFES